MNQFGCIENIILSVNRIEKPFVRDSIIKNVERLKLNYKLMKLTDLTDIPFLVDELLFTPFKEKTIEILNSVGIM